MLISRPKSRASKSISPYEPGNEHQIADNGQIAYAELNFSDRDFDEYVSNADDIKALGNDIEVEGLRVEFGGDQFADEPTFSSEFIGIIAAVIILLIAFGSVIAMGLPDHDGAIRDWRRHGDRTADPPLFLDMPEFTLQLAAMIGIGVGHRLRASYRLALPREPGARDGPGTGSRCS